jgi:hypothetical protein
MYRSEGTCFPSSSERSKRWSEATTSPSGELWGVVAGLQSAIAASGASSQTRVALAGLDWASAATALQSGEGDCRRVLLGFLLVPASTGSIAVVVDNDHGLEGLRVVGT